MISRSEFLEEQMLREYIRRAISIIKERRAKEENLVRTLVRHVVQESAKQFYEFTTLNKLGDVFLETISGASESSLTPFKQQYMSLTSDPGERAQLVDYLIDFAEADFNLLSQGKPVRGIGSDFVDKGFDDEIPDEVDEEEDEDLIVSIEDLNAAGGDILEPEIEDELIGEDSEIAQDSIDDSTLLAAREAYKTIGPALEKAWIRSPTQKPITKDITVEIDNQNTVIPANTIDEGDLMRMYFAINLKLVAEKVEQQITVDDDQTGEPEGSIDPLG